MTNKNTENNIANTDYGASFNHFVYDAIPSNSHCLDVGCSNGNLGNALHAEKNCTIDGIELNSSAAAIARSRNYGEVFEIDLNYKQATSALSIKKKKYDVIVFSDVLEHLISPEQALVQLGKFLRPGGVFVISLPNVAFILNRLHLLFGNWEYKEYGILDRTHLRFYTIKSGCQMISSTGLQIALVKPYNQFGILNHISPLDKWFPSLLAYQFLVVAKKDKSEHIK